MGAMLFLITASALSIAVIFDMITKKPDTNAADQNTASCSVAQVAGEAEKLPADYNKTAGTPKTLQSTDLVVGSGAAAKSGDCLQMKYYGTLAKDGTVFDQNYNKSTALQFQLGKGQVIAGWDQGIAGMRVGGVRRLVIPSQLAYGDAEQGSIPANSTLVFLVKLVAIKNP